MFFEWNESNLAEFGFSDSMKTAAQVIQSIF